MSTVDDVEPARGSVAGADVIDEPENHATVRPLARAGAGSSSLSATWVSLAGSHRELASARSARWYFLLSGRIRVVLEGEDPVELGAEDWITIPCGRRYSLDGHGTYLVVNTPAFASGDDHYTAGSEESAPGAPSRPA